MPYGTLNAAQEECLKKLVAGKVVYDLGAGDLVLAHKLLELGAAKVVAIEKELFFIDNVAPEIEVRQQYFQHMDEDMDIAFVSWPANYDNGLREILKRTKTIIYLGKNTDGSMCGTPALFEYLSTRKIEEHVPSRANTFICYTDTLDKPRHTAWLLQEEEAAINANVHAEPVRYKNPRCQHIDGCREESWDHPEKGMLCLCQEHAELVFAGIEKAPPLRRNRDYQAVGRKTFLIDGDGPIASTDFSSIPIEESLKILEGFATILK
ncbi:hypothetical protein M0R72_01260 [Candidatus Pacearchaeota archaeon]|jgi:hypothetical protein|nr:hypothetical protein [Candidatus Pacearchaeota archaeon]